MFRSKRSIAAVACISLAIVGCSSDDNGDSGSTDRTAQLVGTWVWDEVIRVTQVDGIASAAEEQDVSDSDFETEFFEDGTLELRNDGSTISGSWEFVGDTDVAMTFEGGESTFSILRLTDDELWTFEEVETESGVIESHARQVRK